MGRDARSRQRWQRVSLTGSRQSRRPGSRRRTSPAACAARLQSGTARRSSIISGSLRRVRPGNRAQQCYPEVMDAVLLAITREPLDLNRLTAAVAGEADGAVVTFLGVVRNHNAGRSVRYL